MIIFTFIGVIWTITYIRRMLMSKERFFDHVRDLRSWLGSSATPHQILDSIVETTGLNEKEKSMNEEESLEKDVMRVIKRIKESKEKEKLRAKSKDLIEQIKKSLEE